jgi:hypothetical protein
MVTLMQVRFLRPGHPFGTAFARLGDLLLFFLLLTANGLVEQDGADANADANASTPAPATTTAMAVVMFTRRGVARV